MKRMKRLSKMLGKKDRKGLDADLFGNDGGPQLGKGLAAAECGYVKMDDPSEPKGKVNQVSPGDAFENFHEDKQEAIRVVLGKKDQAGQLEAMQQEGNAFEEEQARQLEAIRIVDKAGSSTDQVLTGFSNAMPSMGPMIKNLQKLNGQIVAKTKDSIGSSYVLHQDDNVGADPQTPSAPVSPVSTSEFVPPTPKKDAQRIERTLGTDKKSSRASRVFAAATSSIKSVGRSQKQSKALSKQKPAEHNTYCPPSLPQLSRQMASDI